MEMTGTRRLIVGIIVLLLVDLIWVASSELSRFIFIDTGYDKPFFSTYLKTSMFSLYLLGFLFVKSWRHQCLAEENELYQVVDMSPEDEQLTHETSSLLGRSTSNERIRQQEQEKEKIKRSFNLENCQYSLANGEGIINNGEPSYEPLKLGEQEKSSDSDDSSIKSVRFSRMTEVRHLSEAEAVEAMLSRLSFSASLRAEQLVKDTANKYPIQTVMKISLLFCFLWFLGTYGYQEALSQTEVGVVNVVSSTSGLFTLILAALFPSSSADRFTLSKFAAVLFMVLGTALISIEDLKLEGSSVPTGIIWALVGALMYACYMVFLKRKVPSEEKMDFTMFFGFVGLFNAFFLWPGLFILNAFGWETLQMPTKQQFLYMFVNGLIGTVFSELLWLWGCFLTSSLMATLSLGLTIPMTMLCDILLKNVAYSWRFYLGSIPIFASFVAVSLLTHFEDKDPLLDAVKAITRLCLGKRRDYRLVAMDCEQEKLIGTTRNDASCNEVVINEEINTSYLSHSNHV